MSYFQILVIAGIIFPFHTLNLTLIIVKGFPKRMFLLEIIRNVLIILSVVIFFQSVQLMLYGFLLASALAYLTGLVFVKKIIRYKIREQIADILPYGVISVVMGGIVYFMFMLDFNLYVKTSLQLVCGGLFYFFALHLLGSKVLKDMICIFKKKDIV